MHYGLFILTLVYGVIQCFFAVVCLFFLLFFWHFLFRFHVQHRIFLAVKLVVAVTPLQLIFSLFPVVGLPVAVAGILLLIILMMTLILLVIRLAVAGFLQPQITLIL